MTGADSPVIADFVDRREALDDVAVAGNDLAGLDENDVADAQIQRVDAFVRAVEIFRVDVALGARVAAALAQRFGLRLAASLRHRLGEIGEQHREPQPERDLAGEQRRNSRVTRSRMKKPVTTTETASVTKITGLLRQRPRVELAQRVDAAALR